VGEPLHRVETGPMRIFEPHAKLRNMLASKKASKPHSQLTHRCEVRQTAFQRIDLRCLIVAQQSARLDAERRGDNWRDQPSPDRWCAQPRPPAQAEPDDLWGSAISLATARGLRNFRVAAGFDLTKQLPAAHATFRPTARQVFLEIARRTRAATARRQWTP